MIFAAEVDSADEYFTSASLCLTLNDVRFLYDFMLNYKGLLKDSRQSANILMEDLNHFIKANKIFQNKKMQLALAMNHID
jgi:hypothetical protein